jgi:hypothetical protein
MTRNSTWKLALVLLLFPASAFAQLPLPAGSGRAISASIGYSYLSLPITSSTSIDLNGVGASLTADFRPRFGAKVDLNYVRQANVFSTGHHSDVLSIMLGPLFYPVNNDRWTVYVQALVGVSRENGVIPDGAGGFDTAYTDALSWAIGGGIERSISSSLAIRTEADFMRTSFVDSSAVIRGQNDLRFTGSLVYRWNWHSKLKARRAHRFF